MTIERVQLIRSRLEEAFEPAELEVMDESHLHIGHPGAATGMGHFRVRLVSQRFEGVKTLERHRMVYDALGDLMRTDIHALSVTALVPQQNTTG